MDYISKELAFEATLDNPPQSPPHVDSYSPTPNSSILSAGTSSSRGSKQKAFMIVVVETQF